MPTVFENIRYFFKRVVYVHATVIEHVVKSAVAILLIALLLEVFCFNFNYFATANLTPIDLKNKIELYEDVNGEFRLTAADHVIEFSNLNTTVENIYIDLDWDQPAQDLAFKIQFTDDAHLTYFDSTEYTAGIPDASVSTKSKKSQYINLNTAGYVNNLRIELVSEEVSYPILLNTIEINANRPFVFNGLRFIIVAGVLALIYIFRPKSAIYRIHIVDNPRESKAGIICAVVLECILVSNFLFFGSNLVGVATSDYNFGEWDGKSFVSTFEVGGDNAQQYAELARSMAEGKLYLSEEPPKWLQEMSSPYDKGARDELQKETGQDYLFDVAYYEGHYYVYFGVVPVIVFYLPFYLLTGQAFPTAIGVLISTLAFILGASALLDRFARYHFKRVSLGLYLLLQISIVACSGVLYLIKFPTFYSMPIALGLAFSVWGLYFWMCGRSSKRRCVYYVLGSLCMALVLGCRPQLVLLSLVAFPLFWKPYITERRILSKRGAREFICLIAPYLIVGIGLMLYNHARFGSFFDFGANYNLTVNDMTKRGWNVGRLAPALFAYFIQPPNACGVFPYLQPVDFATTYMGQTIKEATFGGVFACLPLLWVLFFARPVIALRNSQRSSRTITGVIIVLVLSAVLIALLDAQMAGILQRYYSDFSFMLLAAAVLLVFILNENCSDDQAMGRSCMRISMRERIRSLLRHEDRAERVAQNDAASQRALSLSNALFIKILIVLVAISVLYEVLLCLTPETGWYSDIYAWAYRDILETFQFWK